MTMSTYLIKDLTIQIEQGDITLQTVDAIVNAANKFLQHGGGVAGAIVSRGGNVIQRESNDWVNLHGQVTHDHPAITGPGTLPCRHIIHAVGPIWGEGNEVYKLQQAITASLMVANDLKCTSIAFPAISTGIYGFPMKLAAGCFFQSIADFASSDSLHFLQIIKIILREMEDCLIFDSEFSRAVD
ncbi:MAG: macro domain-containing protein [Leptolinea sp.]|nr:macro domain-containing protein [Leptolinea sp.]